MAVTNYLWDRNSYLEEYDDMSTTITTFTNEPTEFGNIISQRRDSMTNFYHYDVQGSTHQLTENSENVTDTFLYDAWGNETNRTGTTKTSFRYIGELGYYYDEEVVSFYVRARSYSPMETRWDTFDPLLELILKKANQTNLRDPLSTNSDIISGLEVNKIDELLYWNDVISEHPYIYAMNNPTSNSDPSGLRSCASKCSSVFVPSPHKGPRIKDSRCTWLNWLTGDCCTAQQLKAANRCCSCKNQVVLSCYGSHTSPGLWGWECKKPKWKGSIKLRGCCRPGCDGLIVREGGYNSKKECTKGLQKLCEETGCIEVNDKYSCGCGHPRCIREKN